MSAQIVWRVGDRVSLTPTGKDYDRTDGTVTRVDQQGVGVKLDREIRGCRTCTASPAELTRVP